jgi:hypothetical protein
VGRTRTFRNKLKQYKKTKKKGRELRKKQTDKMQNMTYFMWAVLKNFANYFFRTYAFQGPIWRSKSQCRPVEYGNTQLCARVAAFVDSWPAAYSDDSLDSSDDLIPLRTSLPSGPPGPFGIPVGRLPEPSCTGYQDACLGNQEFRRSIIKLTGKKIWKEARKAYIKLMGETGYRVSACRQQAPSGHREY